MLIVRLSGIALTFQSSVNINYQPVLIVHSSACSQDVVAHFQVEEVLASFKLLVVPLHPLLSNHTVNDTIISNVVLVRT